MVPDTRKQKGKIELAREEEEEDKLLPGIQKKSQKYLLLTLLCHCYIIAVFQHLMQSRREG